MQYQDFKEQLKNFVVFSVSDINKIDPDFYPARLGAWQKKGYIKKLRRGYYMFSDVAPNEEAFFLIANKLYAPSYISFESALSYYGLIPEGVYSITSACGKKTARFKAPVADFAYRKVKPQLLFGYNLQKHGNQAYKIADMEKAVLDYLYLNPTIAQEADFHEWRFNSQEFLARADLAKMREYAKQFKNKRLIERLEKLIIMMQHSK